LKDLKLHLRFSSRLIWIAFMGLLAVSVAAMPHRVAAAQAAPAATSEPAIETAPADATPESGESKPAESKEEQQSNAFRLEGPLVKWTAKATGAPVTTVAIGFEVLNFLIIVLGIGIPLVRFLPKFLRNRAAKVRSDIESARKVTEDATARLSAVEAKLSKLDEEIQRFRSEVEAESLKDEARIKASLAEESTRIVESAEQEISLAAAQARRGLRNFAADLAIDQAAKNLVLTPETDRALIAEFVGDVMRNGGSKDSKSSKGGKS
jgi:F-type H+-transporting ATPase subunit b